MTFKVVNLAAERAKLRVRPQSIRLGFENRADCGECLDRIAGSHLFARRVVELLIAWLESLQRRLLAMTQLAKATADSSSNMVATCDANPVAVYGLEAP